MSNPATVQGQKYETFVAGIGASSYVEKCIFIPAPYQLNLSADGGVRNQRRHLMTSAAAEAMRAVCDQVNSKKLCDEKGEDFLRTRRSVDLLMREAIEQADRTALTPVQIPKGLLDQIKELYDQSVDDNTPQGRVPVLKRNMKQLIQESNIFDE